MLSEQDKAILSFDRIDQIGYFASISPEASESTLAYKFFEEPPYSCDIDAGNVRCVPDVDSRLNMIHISNTRFNFKFDLKTI